MKRGLSFTILASLGLLASVAMAMDNNWPGAAFGCIAAGYLIVMASFSPHSDLGGRCDPDYRKPRHERNRARGPNVKLVRYSGGGT